MRIPAKCHKKQEEGTTHDGAALAAPSAPDSPLHCSVSAHQRNTVIQPMFPQDLPGSLLSIRYKGHGIWSLPPGSEQKGQDEKGSTLKEEMDF